MNEQEKKELLTWFARYGAEQARRAKSAAEQVADDLCRAVPSDDTAAILCLATDFAILRDWSRALTAACELQTNGTLRIANNDLYAGIRDIDQICVILEGTSQLQANQTLVSRVIGNG